jgi:hypothetical protein
MSLQSFIQQRSKEQWRSFFQEQWVAARIFMQENGEIASIIGFCVGITAVLFYKLFILVSCILALCYLTILVTAENQSGKS